jgi:hypothetical protein
MNDCLDLKRFCSVEMRDCDGKTAVPCQIRVSLFVILEIEAWKGTDAWSFGIKG